jgi:hypothetical protein
MSADNRTDCPKCTQNYIKQIKDLKDNSCNISSDEFAEKICSIKLTGTLTLREYYHNYIDNKANLNVSYHAECDCCGFSYDYKITKNVLEEDTIKPRCTRCSGELLEVKDILINKHSDDLSPLMKDKEYLFTGLKCVDCEHLCRGSFSIKIK